MSWKKKCINKFDQRRWPISFRRIECPCKVDTYDDEWPMWYFWRPKICVAQQMLVGISKISAQRKKKKVLFFVCRILNYMSGRYVYATHTSTHTIQCSKHECVVVVAEIVYRIKFHNLTHDLCAVLCIDMYVVYLFTFA